MKFLKPGGEIIHSSLAPAFPKHIELQGNAIKLISAPCWPSADHCWKASNATSRPVLWHGLRLLAIDGSTARLPNTDDARATFGAPPEGSSVPRSWRSKPIRAPGSNTSTTCAGVWKKAINVRNTAPGSLKPSPIVSTATVSTPTG